MWRAYMYYSYRVNYFSNCSIQNKKTHTKALRGKFDIKSAYNVNWRIRSYIPFGMLSWDS